MAVECRYYGWDKLPAVTVRAPRGSETCTLISLQSTRIALEKARAEAKKAKGVKDTPPAQKAFIQAFVQPNALDGMPWRNLTDNQRLRAEFLFYQQETSCVFFDMQERVLWSHAKLDGVWLERGFCVAATKDLHPEFRAICGTADLLIVQCSKSELPQVFNGLMELVARSKGKEIPPTDRFRQAFSQQRPSLIGKRVMRFTQHGQHLWVEPRPDIMTMRGDKWLASRENLPECYKEVLGGFDVLVVDTRTEINLLAKNLNRVLKGGEW